MKLLAVSLLVVLVSMPARAQQSSETELPPQEVTPQEIANRSLKGPRAEVISGALVVASAPLVGVMVAILSGPGWFECGFLSEPDPACEARRERERHAARNLAIGIGVSWGLVGGALLAHGGYRIRQIRVARRSLEFTPTFSQRTVGLQLRF